LTEGLEPAQIERAIRTGAVMRWDRLWQQAEVVVITAVALLLLIVYVVSRLWALAPG
jgi:hypothetical protein